MNRWQVVEVGPDGVTQHDIHTTQDAAERAAADMANQLDDNDPTEFYVELVEEQS